MSALGHKRTFAMRKAMSALPPKADIPSSTGLQEILYSQRSADCYST